MQSVQSQTKSDLVEKNISEIVLLVGTTKGAFFFFSDTERKHWEVNGPFFLGSEVNHIKMSYKPNKNILLSLKTPNKLPDIYKTPDLGKTWFHSDIAPHRDKEKTIDTILCLEPANQQNHWYAGTYPAGLFYSEDNGNNWHEINLSFNVNKKIDGVFEKKILGLHTIFVNQKDTKHLIIGIGELGVYESFDSGITWEAMNDGINSEPLNTAFLHSLVLDKHNFKNLYQQNKCGLYKFDAQRKLWKHIGKNLLGKADDFGYPMIIHPRDSNTIWTIPMVGSNIDNSVMPLGRPSLFCSQNKGKEWFKQDIGFPIRNAWFSINPKATITDNLESVGMYIGTTNGAIWISRNEGNSWHQMAVNLPEIISLNIGYV